jgi:hypothetical protein
VSKAQYETTRRSTAQRKTMDTRWSLIHPGESAELESDPATDREFSADLLLHLHLIMLSIVQSLDVHRLQVDCVHSSWRKSCTVHSEPRTLYCLAIRISIFRGDQDPVRNQMWAVPIVELIHNCWQYSGRSTFRPATAGHWSGCIWLRSNMFQSSWTSHFQHPGIIHLFSYQGQVGRVCRTEKAGSIENSPCSRILRYLRSRHLKRCWRSRSK